MPGPTASTLGEQLCRQTLFLLSLQSVRGIQGIKSRRERKSHLFNDLEKHHEEAGLSWIHTLKPQSLNLCNTGKYGRQAGTNGTEEKVRNRLKSIQEVGK